MTNAVDRWLIQRGAWAATDELDEWHRAIFDLFPAAWSMPMYAVYQGA